jgi:hypothetical protein
LVWIGDEEVVELDARSSAKSGGEQQFEKLAEIDRRGCAEARGVAEER